MEQRVKELLNRILHPETQRGLMESGFVANVTANDEKITVVLQFAKVRDPFAPKIQRQVQALLEENFPALKEAITVIIKEAAPKAAQPAEKRTTTGEIDHVIAIASGKGGVGKSTVTANLAVALRNMGYRVGILDADIYGPSQPKMFGLEGYLPEAEQVDGQDIILPAETMGIKIMSIGFFIKPSDALLWRGAMAVNALRQMIHQTRWGKLDFLLADLPPGTGDIHLSIISELKIDEALLSNLPTQNKTLTPEAKRDLIVSLITLKYTQSNSVCYVKNGQAIGVGAGQQSRVHCTRLAGNKADNWYLRQCPKVLELPFKPGIRRADRDNTIDVYIGDECMDVLRDGAWQQFFTEKPEEFTREERRQWLSGLTGVALGSDAFFPFGDNIERAHKSGVEFIAQPGGSIRDDNVIETCDKYGIAMAFTGIRLFHH